MSGLTIDFDNYILLELLYHYILLSENVYQQGFFWGGEVGVLVTWKRKRKENAFKSLVEKEQSS